MTHKKGDIIKIGKIRYRCIIADDELAVFGRYIIIGDFDRTDYCDVRILANNYSGGVFQILRS